MVPALGKLPAWCGRPVVRVGRRAQVQSADIYTVMDKHGTTVECSG